MHRDLGAGITGGADEVQGAVGRPAPVGAGPGSGAPGLAGCRRLGRIDVARVGHLRVAGQAAVHVVLDADQVTYHALHVQATQDRYPPVVVAERAQQHVKGVGRAAERFGRRDLHDRRDGLAGCSRLPGGLQDTLPQTGRKHRR